MASGRDIEIKIAATGGEQAAGEIKKVGDASEDTSRKVVAMESQDTAGSQAGRATRLKEVAAATGAIGIAAGAAAKTLGQIREAFESVDTVSLRNIDSAMADQIDQAKTWATALEDPIGALLKFTTGDTVASAFASMNEQIALNAKQHEEAIDRLIAKGITQRDELKAMADAIKDANEILDAKDAADGKARDRADAKAIRDGAPAEDVAVERAKFDAEREIAKINRGLEAKAPGVQAAFDNLQNAKANAANVANADGAKPEDVEKANKQLADLQKEFDDKQREFQQAQKVAEESRRGIREESSGKIEEATADKSARIQKEKAAAEKKAAEEKVRNDKEAARQADAQLRDERRLSGGSSGGRSSRGGRGLEDDNEAEPSEPTGPARKLSAVEDGNRRAAARAKDREERANARQRDREERGGRKEGSLELRDRDDDRGIPRGAVDQFREDVKNVSGGGGQIGEILSLMRQLSSALASNGGGSVKDYSKEIIEIKTVLAQHTQRFRGL